METNKPNPAPAGQSIPYATPSSMRVAEPLPVRDIPPSPPKAPRPLTADVRRALWTEPRVRRWLYMVVTILLLFAAFCADRLWARHVESELIRTGLIVPTKILGAENKQINQPFSSSDKCSLMLNLPSGPQEIDNVYLTFGGMTGGTITLHVDPADHTRWTDRSEATPLLDSLFVGFLVLPILPLLIVLGLRQLKSFQWLWQNGSPALAVVFDRRQSPIAPMSYVVRCSMQDLRTRDLFSVYIPRIGIGLGKGDLIWVITSSKNGNALAALWMPPAVPPDTIQSRPA